MKKKRKVTWLLREWDYQYWREIERDMLRNWVKNLIKEKNYYGKLYGECF